MYVKTSQPSYSCQNLTIPDFFGNGYSEGGFVGCLPSGPHVEVSQGAQPASRPF